MKAAGSCREDAPRVPHPRAGEQVAESMSALSRIDVHRERLSGDGGEDPRSGVSGIIAADSRIVVQDDGRRGTAVVLALSAMAQVEGV